MELKYSRAAKFAACIRGSGDSLLTSLHLDEAGHGPWQLEFTDMDNSSFCITHHLRMMMLLMMHFSPGICWRPYLQMPCAEQVPISSVFSP
jgi:hypothetical protein